MTEHADLAAKAQAIVARFNEHAPAHEDLIARFQAEVAQVIQTTHDGE